jgi:hypothetical protein
VVKASEGKSAEDLMNVFVQAVTVIGHMLESAFIGLLVETGENAPAKYFVKEPRNPYQDDRSRLHETQRRFAACSDLITLIGDVLPAPFGPRKPKASAGRTLGKLSGRHL